MVDTPRFVPLIDAAEARFDSYIESSHCPPPLPIAKAPSLDDYLRSFRIEIFDWEGATVSGDSWFMRTDDLHDVNANAITDGTRSNCWKVRVQARLEDRETPEVVIGFALNPRLTSHRFHISVYLLLSPECRTRPWTLINSRTREVLDWKGHALVPDGVYELRLEGDLMTIEFNRSRTLFAARTYTLRSRSSSRSSLSTITAKSDGRPPSPPANVSLLPEQAPMSVYSMIPHRDRRCVLSGSLLRSFSLLGTPTVTPILPTSQPWIANELRFVLDPSRGADQDKTEGSCWRTRNHPSNLMMLCSGVKDVLEKLAGGVDVLTTGRPIVQCFGSYRGLWPDDKEVVGIHTDGYHVPNVPYEADGIPGPSPCFLLLHYMSCLAATCRLRMSDELADDVDLEDSEDGDDDDDEQRWEPPARLLRRFSRGPSIA